MNEGNSWWGIFEGILLNLIKFRWLTCQLWVWQMYFHVTTKAPRVRNICLLQTALRIPLIFPVSFSPSLSTFNLWWVCSYNFFICHYDFNIHIGKNILYIIPGVCIHLLAQYGCESPLNLLILTFVITTYSMTYLFHHLIIYSLFKRNLISIFRFLNTQLLGLTEIFLRYSFVLWSFVVVGWVMLYMHA